MEATFLQRHPLFKDVLQIIVFVVLVVAGTIFINTFVFRSFSVVGPSMEETFYTGDRLVVNRLSVTWSSLRNQPYTPERGQIIVFKNPRYSNGLGDEHLVKRVIAFSGERVVVKDGSITVYNDIHPTGFNPDTLPNSGGIIGEPTTGDSDITVPRGEIYVVGDHRQGSYSHDSRNGLGTVPLYDVVGPVTMRIFPFNKMEMY
jgi:signal peptidase I